MERPDGALAWGTFRPTETEARAIWDKWNPAPECHPDQACVVRADILIFDK